MSFFATFHRSIVDPSLYAEIGQPRGMRRALGYGLMLVTVAGIIGGIAQGWNFLDAANPFYTRAQRIFEGVVIKGGQLESQRELPAVLLDNQRLQRLFGAEYQQGISFGPDTLIVADTSAQPKVGNALYVLGAQGVTLLPDSKMHQRVPYDSLFGAGGEFDFSASRIHALFRARSTMVFIFAILFEVIRKLLVTPVSVIYLAIAAYILSYRPTRPSLKAIVAMGVYASTPLVLLNTLQKIAHTDFEMVEYAGVFFACIVLYRGIGYVVRSQNAENVDKV